MNGVKTQQPRFWGTSFVWLTNKHWFFVGIKKGKTNQCHFTILNSTILGGMGNRKNRSFTAVHCEEKEEF